MKMSSPSVAVPTNAAPFPSAATVAVDAEHEQLRQKAAAMRKHTSTDTSCYLCLEEFTDVEAPILESLPCGHRADAICVEQMIQSPAFTNTCGICRSKIELFCPTEPVATAADNKKTDSVVNTGAAPLSESVMRYNMAQGSLNMAQTMRSALNPISVVGYASYARRNFSILPASVKVIIIMSIIVAFVYLMLPTELLPDRDKKTGNLSLVGLSDDAVVVWFCVLMIFIAIRRAFTLTARSIISETSDSIRTV